MALQLFLLQAQLIHGDTENLIAVKILFLKDALRDM